MRIGMFLGLTLVFGAVWTAGAEAASTSAGEGDFIGPNDRVVFLGDSITHGGAYGEYVSLFYATRYPGSDRWFSNSGWSGASLPQGIASVDEDVVAKTPTVVTVFYGMNDSGSQESWPVDSPDYPGRSARKLREYETNYTNLLALIAAKAKSPRIVYVTPSPYDQTCNDRGKTVATRKNDVMGLMAEWVQARAAAVGAPCVDLYGSLMRVNTRGQAKDPAFSVLRQGNDDSGRLDRVHPGPFGHMLFLDAFVRAFHAPGLVDEITASAGGRRSCTFTCRERALPFPADANMARAYGHCSFVDDFNREILRIRDLVPGTYRVTADGREIGRWTSGQLADGVNIATNAATPQYQQALKVKALNAQLWSRERDLRLFLTRRRWLRMHYKVDPDDLAAVKTLRESIKDKKGCAYDYSTFGEYLKKWPDREKVTAEAERLRREIKEAAKPVEHAFTAELESRDISVSYDAATGGFAVSDSAAGRTWSSLPGAACPDGIRVSHRVEGRELVVTLSADAGRKMSEIDFPRPFAAERGDRILLTQGNGFLFPAEMTDLGTDKVDFSRYPTRDMEMGCFGHLSETAGYLAIVETPEDCGQRYSVGSNGLRQPNVVWLSEHGKFGYERRIRYVFFKDPTPMKMALRYREEMKRKGYYKLFPEKMRERPAMAERYAMLAGAPNVWIWEEDGDKAGFARELKELGFGSFLLQSANRRDLGVWITPEEIRNMAKVPGVLPGVYDIYRDFMDPKNLPLIDCVRPYWPTNVWENGDYVLASDGSVARGWGVNRKGTTDAKNRIGCALLCEGRSWPYAQANLRRDLKAAPHAARLFDVVGGSLGECFNPRHPLTRRTSRIARRDFFAHAEGEFGVLAGTEDGSECFVGCCSYFEGTMSAPNHYRVDGGRYMWRLYDEVPDCIRRGTDPATRVPFFDMVFHGCVNLYWYWCDYNNKFPSLWHRRDLFDFVTGEPPMYFFTRETFAKQKGSLAASYALATSVAKATFGVPMSDYRWLTSDRLVQQSAFENGVVATVNFGEKTFVMADGFSLAPGGHRLERGK